MVGKGSVNHNSREFNAKNTDPERTHLNTEYCNIDIKEVYHYLFDDALETYNEKQKRADRRIENYYEKIRTGRQEKLFHEIIIQIGNHEDTNAKTPEGELAERILDEYYRDFQKRNPYLYVFSAHLHMDEATPHLHIDFVPFTTKSKRGLDTRVSLKQALANQGFIGKSRQETEWALWVESEKEALSKVMEHHGVHWEKKGTHEKHLSVYDYEKKMRKQEVEELTQQTEELNVKVKELTAKYETLTKYEVNIDELTEDFYEQDEFKLPDPPPLMTAKTYKTKFIEPLFNKLIGLVKGLAKQCINDYTGNLVFASNAVSTSNELMPLSIDCIYNGYASDGPAVVGKSGSTQTWLGCGWRFSIQQTLISSGSYGLKGDARENYPYVYTDGDGTEHYIYKNDEDEDNIVYEDEDGLGLTLTFDEGHDAPQWYLLTDKKDNTLKFNANGNLIESKDANGNIITITYSGKKINKVTDGSGKSYTFVYAKTSSGDDMYYVAYILHPSGERTSFIYQYNAPYGNLASITHTDGSVSYFTYESGDDRAMLTARDSENYKLTFTYSSKTSGKYVTSVTEHGGSTQGQKITFDRSVNNTTKIRTAGTDGVYGNSNDLITTYQFDDFGKTISQQLSTNGGVSSVAGAYEYTEKNASSLASANKVSSAAGLGKNVVNHVSNSNAEASTGWATYRSAATANFGYSSDYAYIGQKSLLVNTTEISALNGTANVNQSVSGLVAGRDYTFSAYVKTTEMSDVHSGSRTGAFVALRTTDTDGNMSTVFSEFIGADTSVAINGGWRRLNVTVKLPTGCTSAQFFAGVMNSIGKVYFDCLQLEEGTVVNDYNLLENSSFENATNGLPNKWSTKNVVYTTTGTTVTEGVTSTYKKEGSYGLIFQGEGTQDQYVLQTVQVGGSVNDTYILSGWAIANAAKKVSHHSDAMFHICIRVNYDKGNGEEYFEYKDPLAFNPDVTSQWQYAAKAFTLKSKTHPTYKPVSVNIYIVYHRQINRACFDNVQLIKDVAQSYAYDSEGNITSVSANAQQKESLVYDSDKEDLEKYTDAMGYTTNYTYDNKHNLTSAKSPGNVQTNYTYNSNGNQTSTTLKGTGSNLTIKSESSYTDTLTLSGSTVKAGSYVEGAYDEHGNKTSYYYNILKDLSRGFRNVLNVYTEYVYNDDSEKLETVRTFKLDSNNSRVYLNSPVNYTYSGSKLTGINYGSDNYSFDYDSFGNVVSTSVGGKPLSTNTYGANNGVLQSTTYGNGAVKNYTYDSFGNLASVGNGTSTQFTWTYDSAMNPMTHIDNVNELRYNYEYDGIGRLIRQELRTADNSTHLGATEFTYDLRNNVTKVTNEIGGRAVPQWYYYIKIDGVSNSERYAKDNLPVRYSMPMGRYVDYGYDNLNRLTKKTLSTETPLISCYSYKTSNRESTKAAGDTNSYTTTQLSAEHSGKIAYFYTYDVAGNITKIQKADSNGSGNPISAWTNYRTYTYDDLCQLTSETNATTGKTYTYTYDNVGNITSKSDGTDTITYTYGTDSDAGWSKLLTSYNGQPIDYDKIGDPVLYRGANLTWTGRQLNSYNKDGTSINYTYDADGLRASKTVNDTKTTYQYLDGKLYYQETNGDDSYFYYDSYGNITAIACYPESGTSSYVLVGTNSLGDVNALYNANGDLLVKYEYDAWGNVIAETDANGNALTGSAKTWSERNPFRYRGYVYDAETRLYYNNSRYYDAEVGRFISADNVIDTSTTTGINVFSYCANNPVMREDTNGHFWDTVLDIVSVAYSTYQVIKEPTKISNWVGLAADIVSAIVPIATGGGAVVRAAAKADDIVDFGKGLTKSDDVYDAVKASDDLYAGAKNVTSFDITKETFLPNDYYTNLKAPIYGTPNSSYTCYKYNDFTKEFEKSTAYYDFAGRQNIRIDYTNHGRLDHGNPHIHLKNFSAQFPSGNKIRLD